MGWYNEIPRAGHSPPAEPDVMPRACLPLDSGPPESPGSAQMLVWIRFRTRAPPPYLTVTPTAVTTPECLPVVEPTRVAFRPT